ncbi:Methylated-DNA-(protein)-cysteine S-methyltransferase DNA binding protein [Fibrella aestuarina BUZ 2]|uniref:Methylated-DNA-(Protein)-cysteine S-methyltransferase DNA binding protein n=1 Tax=Fibrella aestuarina BUZ 2 TaxID=1166018 RepID=I0K7Y2_9BACT|nr:MGMT family protein [Fibrella aestuarina]CCH00235.1 Methylated-DNA-(protein)-cysteine S-methyltransferase DNA binding protein [Fibrella aestuarina BUZ 2]
MADKRKLTTADGSVADPQRDYFEDVYEVVKQVPVGRVTTYGSIAQYLSLRAGARMVGWAMTAAHGRDDVPAHRVVNRLGILSGKNFFGSPTRMQELLEAEGVAVDDDTVVDFKNRLWDPSIELAS